MIYTSDSVIDTHGIIHTRKPFMYDGENVSKPILRINEWGDEMHKRFLNIHEWGIIHICKSLWNINWIIHTHQAFSGRLGQKPTSGIRDLRKPSKSFEKQTKLWFSNDPQGRLKINLIKPIENQQFSRSSVGLPRAAIPAPRRVPPPVWETCATSFG